MTAASPRILHRLTAAGAALAGLSAAMSIGNALFMPRLRRMDISKPHDRVVVCIPARDEESTVPLLIADLRAQTYAGELRVIVLDDGSGDGTLAAARRAADGDPRITVVSTCDPPSPGWTGKAAACRTLADIGLEDQPDVIVFVDADVRLSPGAVAASVAALRGREAALLCPWPEQKAGSVAEHLVQPLLAFSWMSTLSVPLANRSLRQSLSVACGQFLMFDADAYREIGGHESVASSATEDLDIARTLRSNGKRTILVSGAGFVSCRMYRDWPQLREGYTRWLWSSFGGRMGTAAALAGVSIVYLLPPAAAVLGTGSTRRLGSAGYLAAVTARLCSAQSESAGRANLADLARACAHPISAALFATLVLDSRRRFARNELSWKSRPLNAPTIDVAALASTIEK
jgi:glycosyltransferase involved in cell wall biosynthesis